MCDVTCDGRSHLIPIPVVTFFSGDGEGNEHMNEKAFFAFFKNFLSLFRKEFLVPIINSAHDGLRDHDSLKIEAKL